MAVVKHPVIYPSVKLDSKSWKSFPFAVILRCFSLKFLADVLASLILTCLFESIFFILALGCTRYANDKILK